VANVSFESVLYLPPFIRPLLLQLGRLSVLRPRSKSYVRLNAFERRGNRFVSRNRRGFVRENVRGKRVQRNVKERSSKSTVVHFFVTTLRFRGEQFPRKFR